MKKIESVNFKATPEQRERIDQLAQALGKSKSQLLRELVDGATLMRPVLMSTFNPIPVGYENKTVHHVQAQ